MYDPHSPLQLAVRLKDGTIPADPGLHRPDLAQFPALGRDSAAFPG
jgi:hypothetical protein